MQNIFLLHLAFLWSKKETLVTVWSFYVVILFIYQSKTPAPHPGLKNYLTL